MTMMMIYLFIRSSNIFSYEFFLVSHSLIFLILLPHSDVIHYTSISSIRCIFDDVFLTTIHYFFYIDHIFTHISAAGSLGRLPMIKTSLEDDGEQLKKDFKKYLSELFATIAERREQEEMGILNSR